MAVTIQGIQGIIEAGTYTPTLYNTTNVAASTAYVCQYIKVGNVVTVSGQVDIDPTAGSSTATLLGISLPISSNLASATQCAGSCGSGDVAHWGIISGDSTNDRASLQYLANSSSNDSLYFTFTYLII